MIRFHKNRTIGILISAGVFTAVCFSCAAVPKETGAGMVARRVSAAAQVPCCDSGIPVLASMDSGCAEFQEAVAKKIREAQEMERRGTDAELLASIIFCEAGNQSFEGQVAVGAVVLNRMHSDQFPDSMEEVIYQPGQFGPVSTGWLDRVRRTSGYTDSALKAAQAALNGENPIGNCLYFDQGGSGKQIGAHYFH